MIIIKPIVKGIAISVFLGAIGVTGFSGEWWVAAIALNTMANL